MTKYNWTKKKALTVAILTGLVIAVAGIALITFAITPTIDDHDLKMVVSMAGGLINGWIASQVGLAIYTLKAAL